MLHGNQTCSLYNLQHTPVSLSGQHLYSVCQSLHQNFLSLTSQLMMHCLCFLVSGVQCPVPSVCHLVSIA